MSAVHTWGGDSSFRVVDHKGTRMAADLADVWWDHMHCKPCDGGLLTYDRDRICVGPGGGGGPGQRPWPAGGGGAGVQGFCYRVMLGPRWWLWTSATTLACGRWQSRRQRRSLAAAMRAWWRASGYALFLHQPCPTAFLSNYCAVYAGGKQQSRLCKCSPAAAVRAW